MMEVELNGKSITIGILGLITALLMGFGGSELLSQEQFDNAFVCEASEELGIFLGGISGTALTGYPFSDSRKSPARCKFPDDSNSKWIPLEKWAEDRNVDPLLFVIQNSMPGEVIADIPVEPINYDIDSGSLAYCCSPGGVCVDKVGSCS